MNEPETYFSSLYTQAHIEKWRSTLPFQNRVPPITYRIPWFEHPNGIVKCYHPVVYGIISIFLLTV